MLALNWDLLSASRGHLHSLPHAPSTLQPAKMCQTLLMLSLCLLLPARENSTFTELVRLRQTYPNDFPCLKSNVPYKLAYSWDSNPSYSWCRSDAGCVHREGRGGLGGHCNMLLNPETCSHTALHDYFPPDSEETQSPRHDLPGYLCEITFLNCSTKSVTVHHRPKSYIFNAIFLSCPPQFVLLLCSSKKPS